VRDESPYGSTAPPAAFYLYSPDRRAERAHALLKGCRGHLHADAYAGFAGLYEADPLTGAPAQLTEVACWAHARRKIYDIHVETKSPAAAQALEIIARLFAIESGIKGKPPAERLAARRAKATPIRRRCSARWFRSTDAPRAAARPVDCTPVDVAGRHRDEAAPSGVRRAALVAEVVEERHEPIHDAVRLQVRAAIGADHRPGRLRGARQSPQGAPQVGMHGDAPSPALLRDYVADVDRARHATLRIEDHGPIEAGDFAGAQAGLDRRQDHRAVAGGERGQRPENSTFRRSKLGSGQLQAGL
jgi:Transposase IS66 family